MTPDERDKRIAEIREQADPDNCPGLWGDESVRFLLDALDDAARRERERIVAWLRAEASHPYWQEFGLTVSTLKEAAAAIEVCEHHKDTP